MATERPILFSGPMIGCPDGIRPKNYVHARDVFADLWRSINGAESWDANPWVWVVTFKREEAR